MHHAARTHDPRLDRPDIYTPLATTTGVESAVHPIDRVNGLIEEEASMRLESFASHQEPMEDFW